MAMPVIEHFAKNVKKFLPFEYIRFHCSVKLPLLRGNKSSENSNNLNYELCERLQELAIYDAYTNKNGFKAFTYWKAITVLKSIDWKVTSGRQAMELPGIGNKLSGLIDMLLSNQRLKIQDIIRNDERTKIIEQLTYVPEIGTGRAIKLVKRGIRTFKDLKNHEANIPGLKYVNDFRQKIPRAEIEQIYDIIKDTAVEIDQNYIVLVCGSYRRGAAESSKIDLLLTHPDYIDRQKNPRKWSTLLKTLLRNLVYKKLIVDFSTCNLRELMAVCRLPHDETKPYRKLNVHIDPYNEHCCNLFYSTGNAYFISNALCHASKKNYALNRYYLRPLLSNGKVGPHEIIKCEEDIFSILELPYKKPTERNL